MLKINVLELLIKVANWTTASVIYWSEVLATDPEIRDSWCYQIFLVVVGLERGTLSIMITSEELLGRKSSGSGLENRDYGHRDPPSWPRDTLHPQKLALTSSLSDGCSVGIVRSRTTAMELLLVAANWTGWSTGNNCTLRLAAGWCSLHIFTWTWQVLLK
jgi:hypothetical protein